MLGISTDLFPKGPSMPPSECEFVDKQRKTHWGKWDSAGTGTFSSTTQTHRRTVLPSGVNRWLFKAFAQAFNYSHVKNPLEINGLQLNTSLNATLCWGLTVHLDVLHGYFQNLVHVHHQGEFSLSKACYGSPWPQREWMLPGGKRSYLLSVQMLLMHVETGSVAQVRR